LGTIQREIKLGTADAVRRRMNTNLRFVAAFVVLGSAACSSQIELPPDDDGSCEERVPATNGWCPPAWACVDGEWIETAGACPEPACPATRPDDGVACLKLEQECRYTEDVPCGPQGQVTSTCTESGWVTMVTYCQPEPTCPDAMPSPGSDCSSWDYAYFCQYEVACDELALVTMSCDYTTPTPTWKVDGDAPVCGSCDAAGDPASCSANLGCAWRVPGCASDGQTPIVEGCYPAFDCLNAESCPNPDEVCTPKVYDPCFGSMCDACGAVVGVCTLP
jgi:hypothetical protein